MRPGCKLYVCQYLTFPQRERSERVGFSACVKHNLVVPSIECFSLGLEKFSDISLEPNLLVWYFIVSTTLVLVDVFVVSAWVWTLRLILFQSRSWHWDSDCFSLGLGLGLHVGTVLALKHCLENFVGEIALWSKRDPGNFASAHLPPERSTWHRGLVLLSLCGPDSRDGGLSKVLIELRLGEIHGRPAGWQAIMSSRDLPDVGVQVT